MNNTNTGIELCLCHYMSSLPSFIQINLVRLVHVIYYIFLAICIFYHTKKALLHKLVLKEELCRMPFENEGTYIISDNQLNL